MAVWPIIARTTFPNFGNASRGNSTLSPRNPICSEPCSPARTYRSTIDDRFTWRHKMSNQAMHAVPALCHAQVRHWFRHCVPNIHQMVLIFQCLMEKNTSKAGGTSASRPSAK
jgi:hypothetical protein